MKLNIRVLDRDSEEEIILVASRMQQTLMDVMGDEDGSNYYSIDWLTERVRFHIELLDDAEIFLIENEETILGHAIVRRERDTNIPSVYYGYFSTIYVIPGFRRTGAAFKLVEKVHQWCLGKSLDKVIYNTALGNVPMISLLEKFNYQITYKNHEMVSYSRSLNND